MVSRDAGMARAHLSKGETEALGGSGNEAGYILRAAQDAVRFLVCDDLDHAGRLIRTAAA